MVYSRKMNVFDRSINLDALFKFSQISRSTQVYGSLAVCMLVAAAGSWLFLISRLLQGGLSMLGSLALMGWLAMTPHSPHTERKRLAILAGFAFFTGLGLGTLMDYVISVNPSIILTVFLGTSVIFSCFTLSAGVICSWEARVYLGLVIMCGFVLFDTQLIIEKAETGDKDYICLNLQKLNAWLCFKCVDLFLDFVTIFRKLLIILSMNEKEKKKEKT